MTSPRFRSATFLFPTKHPLPRALCGVLCLVEKFYQREYGPYLVPAFRPFWKPLPRRLEFRSMLSLYRPPPPVPALGPLGGSLPLALLPPSSVSIGSSKPREPSTTAAALLSLSAP